MIIPTYRFNWGKWNQENEFYQSELEKGHIDLTSPMDKSSSYWELGEIETETYEKIDGNPDLIIYRTDTDFLISSGSTGNPAYLLFSDYLRWITERKITIDDDLAWMVRELKLSTIL